MGQERHEELGIRERERARRRGAPQECEIVRERERENIGSTFESGEWRKYLP
jgi:hypothetical protein